MVRCKSTPVKKFCQPEFPIGVEDFESISDNESALHPNKIHVFKTGFIRGKQLQIVTQTSTHDKYTFLSNYYLGSINKLSLCSAELHLVDRRILITLHFHTHAVTLRSKEVPHHVFFELLRLVKSDDIVLTVNILESFVVALNISFRSIMSIEYSNLSYFNMSSELYQWITKSSNISYLASNSHEVNGFCADHLLGVVCEYSTASLPAHSEQMWSPSLRDDLRQAGLLPEFREYQVTGVEWMIRREGWHLQNRKDCAGDGTGMDESSDTANTDASQDNRVGIDVQGWCLLPRGVGLAQDGFFFPVECEESALTSYSCFDYSYSYNPDESRDYSGDCDVNSMHRSGDVWCNILTEQGVVIHSKDCSEGKGKEGEGFGAGVDLDWHSSCDSDDDDESCEQRAGYSYESETSHRCCSWTPSTSQLVRGGILADEPGLGKTVELLGLIAVVNYRNHYFSDNADVGVTRGGVGLDDVQGGLCEIESSHAGEKIEGESLESRDGATSVCVCMRESFSKKLHKGWVQCDVCDSYVHITCAGFANEIKAKACRRYECLICTCCRLAKSPLQSRSTLIVVPGSLLGQWEREIQRHTDPNIVTYLVYSGMKHAEGGPAREAPTRMAMLHPEVLAGRMIVLTSFEILATELNRSESPFAGQSGKPNYNSTRKFFDPVDVTCPRSLRYVKKYRFAPSPLLCVQWERICLDEAQLVEGATSAAAKMAHKLHCSVRWCVSGTPVGNGKLDDLYGLFLFLQQDPLCDKQAWKRLIRDQYSLPDITRSSSNRSSSSGDVTSRKSIGMMRLESICCQLMLSRTKAAVNGQLMLPSQEQIVKFLQLGAVERLFYKKQHDDCLTAVRNTSNQTEDVSHLSAQLRMLRQAACHPQLGSNGIASQRKKFGKCANGLNYQVTDRGLQVMSMDEILFKLIDAAKLRCEEVQRKLIMNRCAAAGIMRIKHQILAIQTDDEEQANSMAGYPSAALHFLTAARKEYQNALECYTANRQESIVFGFVSLLDSSKAMQEVNHSFVIQSAERQRADSISCLWCHITESIIDISLSKETSVSGRYLKENDGFVSDIDTRDYSKRFRLDFGESLANEFDAQAEENSKGQGCSKKTLSSVIPSCQGTPFEYSSHMKLSRALSCKIDLGTPRRLVNLQYAHDVRGSVRFIRNHHSASVDGMPEDRVARVLCGVVVFPASFTIQCQAANSSSVLSDNILYSNVHSCETSISGTSQAMASFMSMVSNGHVWSSCGDFCSTSHRSRQWRLVVNSVHQVGLAVYSCTCRNEVLTNTLQDCCCTCCEIVNLSSPNSFKAEAASTVWATCSRFRLFEAEFDLDLLQELHVTSNYFATAEALKIFDQPLFPAARPNDPTVTPKKRPRLYSTSYYNGSDIGVNSDDESTPSIGLVDSLRTRSTILRDQNVSLAMQAKESSKSRLAEVLAVTDNLRGQLDEQGGWSWLRDVLCFLSDGGPGIAGKSKSKTGLQVLADELMRALHAAVDSNGHAYLSISHRLKNTHSLMIIAHELIEALMSTRASVVQAITNLSDIPSKSEIEENSQCRRCRADWGQIGPVCRHCRLEDKIIALEYLLHSFRRQGRDIHHFSHNLEDNERLDLDGNVIRALQMDAYEVDGGAIFIAKIVLRFINTHTSQFQRNYEAGHDFDVNMAASVGAVAVDILGSMQREVRQIRTVWRLYLHCLSSLDEVQLAVRPLQLLTLADVSTELGHAADDRPGAHMSHGGSGGSRNGYIVQGEEDDRLDEYRVNIAIAQEEMKEAIGHLSYVKNLAAARLFAKSGGHAVGVDVVNRAELSVEVSSNGDDKGRKECVVCMEALEECVECMVTPCGHSFHRECFDWLIARGNGQCSANPVHKAVVRTSFKCPVCRRVCSTDDVMTAGTFISSVTEVVSREKKCVRLSSDEDYSSQLVGSMEDASKQREIESNPVEVRGQWGTKITAVVQDLFPLVVSGEKAILFSQWDQLLDIMSAALTANGICHEKIMSKKTFDHSLVRFTCDPSVTVLLLPLKSGAQGLTVVEANHIFFMEPMLNLEQEQQAMNRIHRIGQTRRTFIHRYIIEDTVETKIYDLYRKRHDGGSLAGTEFVKRTGTSKNKDDQGALTLLDMKQFLGETIGSDEINGMMQEGVAAH